MSDLLLKLVNIIPIGYSRHAVIFYRLEHIIDYVLHNIGQFYCGQCKERQEYCLKISKSYKENSENRNLLFQNRLYVNKALHLLL